MSAATEQRIVELRCQRKLGPHRLAAILGIPRSTCYAVLRRQQLHRLDWLDRPTGLPVRRYEWSAPGELLHIDVKKLGRIPDGGGHRALGRSTETRRAKPLANGWDYIHAAIDDHSRLAYAEVHPNELRYVRFPFPPRPPPFLSTPGVLRMKS